jgi:hypothetical protein
MIANSQGRLAAGRRIGGQTLAAKGMTERFGTV